MNPQLFNTDNFSKHMILFASLAYVAAVVIIMSHANIFVHFIHKQKTTMAVPWAHIGNKRVFPFHKYWQNHHRKPAKQNYLHTFTFSDQLTSSFGIPFNVTSQQYSLNTIPPTPPLPLVYILQVNPITYPSIMWEQKPMANTLSLTVFKGNRILSLLKSVRLNLPTTSKLLWNK